VKIYKDTENIPLLPSRSVRKEGTSLTLLYQYFREYFIHKLNKLTIKNCGHCGDRSHDLEDSRLLRTTRSTTEPNAHNKSGNLANRNEINKYYDWRPLKMPSSYYDRYHHGHCSLSQIVMFLGHNYIYDFRDN
jgi:hypothetical protein